MKKFLAVLLCATMLFCMIPAFSATAAGETIDSTVFSGQFDVSSSAFNFTQDAGLVVSGTKNLKDNISIVKGNTVTDGYTDNNVVKYDHLQGSYCAYSTHQNYLTWNRETDNVVFPGMLSGSTFYKVGADRYYLVTVNYYAVNMETTVGLGVSLCASNNLWQGCETTRCTKIDAVTDGWETISFIYHAPAELAMFNNTVPKCIPFLYIQPDEDKNVTLYFDKMIIKEIPSAILVGEDGSETSIAGETGKPVTFPADKVFDAAAPDGTGYTVTGTLWYTDPACTVLADQSVTFGTARKTYFYAKYNKLVDYGDSQVSFCGFENSTVIPKDGFLSAENQYVISHYTKNYTYWKTLDTTVNGVEHVWDNPEVQTNDLSISGTNGFSSNFCIVNGGYHSNRALCYKQLQNNTALAYKIADISNGVLFEDNTTYHISFYYKAEGTSNQNLSFGVTSCRSSWHTAAFAKVTVPAVSVASDWTRVDITYTTDFSFHDSNYSYNDEVFCIPGIVVNDDKNDFDRTVYMDAFSVSRVVTSSGVSSLTNEAAATAGGQAMRFYFSYSVNADGSVNVGGKNLTVVERGFLAQRPENRVLAPAADGLMRRSAFSTREYLVKENIGSFGIVGVKKTENLENVWSYENGMVTYSGYIKDFSLRDTRKISVRGYIVLSDGTVCYGNIKDYYLNQVVDNTRLMPLDQTYSFSDASTLEKVKIEGAYQATDHGISFDWTGSTAVVKAECTGEVTFTLYLPSAADQMYYTLYVNGERLPDRYTPTLIDSENKLYAISVDFGMSAETRTIELARQTQAYHGYGDLVSVRLHGNLLSAEKNDKLIEFLGDSITCGHGDIGLGGTAVSSDGTQAYAYRTARTLGVDWRIRSKSGIGIKYDYNGGSFIKGDWISSYKYENPWRSTSTPYSVEREADVVCVYLGTNDKHGYPVTHNESSFNMNDPTTYADFVKNIKQLAGIVKSYNPDAKLVWITGGMTDFYGGAAKQVMEELGGTDAGYYFCEISLGMTAGGDGHPTAAQQQKMSEQLIDFLRNNQLVE